MNVAMDSDYVMPRVEMNEEPSRDPKDRLLDVLDRIEAHVEDLRKESLRLEERKDALFTTLDAIRNSDHLGNLCKSRCRYLLKILSIVARPAEYPQSYGFEFICVDLICFCLS